VGEVCVGNVCLQFLQYCYTAPYLMVVVFLLTVVNIIIVSCEYHKIIAVSWQVRLMAKVCKFNFIWVSTACPAQLDTVAGRL